MPFYSYRCPKCLHEINDVRETMSEHGKIMVCPMCGDKMEQKFDTMRYVLKDSGVGWSGDGYSKRRKK
jgi:putative FmdB family regulatory protein